MWVLKAVGLSWEKAQQALKDGLSVRINSDSTWVHGGPSGPVMVLLDATGSLITRPPYPGGFVLMGDAARARVPARLHVWKPHPDELAYPDWAAYAWEEKAA